jgi:hypothetical protein
LTTNSNSSSDNGGQRVWIYKVRPVDPASTANVDINASPIISGNRLYVLADDGSMLAFSPEAPDRTAPLVWGETPDRTRELSGRPPITYLVSVADDGSGIDPNSIVMTVDGQRVNPTYDEYRGYIYYKIEASRAGSHEPVQPLPSGRHEVRVELADWMGNKAVHDWSFQVNNNIADSRPLIIPQQ